MRSSASWRTQHHDPHSTCRRTGPRQPRAAGTQSPALGRSRATHLTDFFGCGLAVYHVLRRQAAGGAAGGCTRPSRACRRRWRRQFDGAVCSQHARNVGARGTGQGLRVQAGTGACPCTAFTDELRLLGCVAKLMGCCKVGAGAAVGPLLRCQAGPALHGGRASRQRMYAGPCEPGWIRHQIEQARRRDRCSSKRRPAAASCEPLCPLQQPLTVTQRYIELLVLALTPRHACCWAAAAAATPAATCCRLLSSEPASLGSMIASIKKTTFHRDVYEPAEVRCSLPPLGNQGPVAAAWEPRPSCAAAATHLPHRRGTRRGRAP